MSNRHACSWGVTAHSTEWTTIDAQDEDGADTIGGYGFVRVVEPGVVYFQPKVVEGLATWVETPRSRGRGFAMAWHDDVEPSTVRTLLDFHAELAPRRATLDKDDPSLHAFDEAVLQMVRLADRVHRAGGTLGFLQPGSVVFCTLRDGRIQAVFPDIGFAWDDQRGIMEPRWIAEPQMGQLFEEGARKHNAAYLQLNRDIATTAKDIVKQTAATAAVQAIDVRVLARLIAVALAGPDEVRRWCGEGQSFLRMPGRNVAPDTQAPIWDQVIAPALLGGIKTCEELARRLELSKPSEHFLFKPPAPPPLWKKVAKQAAPAVAGVVVLVAMGAVALWLMRDDRPRPPLCPNVAKGSPLYDKLFELVDLQTSAWQRGDIEPYWDELRACKGLAGGNDCVAGLISECALKIDESARSLIKNLRDNPLPPAKAREKVDAAIEIVQEAISEVGTGETGSRLSGTVKFLRIVRQSFGAAPTGGAAAPTRP
ncbi:MAG: hypothetical protein ACKOZU_07120 [Planctomycetaceae bacterium]